MKPPGLLKDIEMLHLALSSMPGGRANSPDIVTWLMNHQIQIRWINPDVNELRSCINNALFRALRGNQPKVIAHQPQWPKKLRAYILYIYIYIKVAIPVVVILSPTVVVLLHSTDCTKAFLHM